MPDRDRINLQSFGKVVLGKSKPAAGVGDALGQSFLLRFGVIAQELDYEKHLADHGRTDAQFPVLEGCHMDAQTVGNLLLQEGKLQTTPFQLLSQGLRGGLSGWGDYPLIGTGATQALDVQVAIWQRMPRVVSQLGTSGNRPRQSS
jgi:hypothetical protein